MQVQSYLDHPSHGRAAARPAVEGHLTADQLTRLARALHDDVEQLHQRLAHNEDIFGLLVDDASVDGNERQAARRAAEQDLESIQRTNQAIAAIDDGTYGHCTVCGKVIPFERLEALPATRTCVACPDQ